MAIRSEALLPGAEDLEPDLRQRLQADGCAVALMMASQTFRQNDVHRGSSCCCCPCALGDWAVWREHAESKVPANKAVHLHQNGTRRPPTIFGMDQAARGIWHAVNWRLLHDVAASVPGDGAAAATAAEASLPSDATAAALAPVMAASAAAAEPMDIPADVAAAAAAAAQYVAEPQVVASPPALPHPAAEMPPPAEQQQQQQHAQPWADQAALYAQWQHSHHLQQQQQHQHHQQAQGQAMLRQLEHKQQAMQQQEYQQQDQHHFHNHQEESQDGTPLGRGHRKKAPSARINLAVQGEQVL